MINATIIPKSKQISSSKVNKSPNFFSFKRLAPNIIGIARKKVNSVAAARDTPKIIPPIIVDPDREVPGTKDNTWNIPIPRAVKYEISSTEFTSQLLFFLNFSTTIKTIP